jgi:hypothetical protein
MGWVLGGYLLYPNLFPVVSGEFHPGTLALLPLAWAVDALDRGRLKEFAIAAGLVLCCREDLALVVACLATLFALTHPGLARGAWALTVLSLAYTALFFFVVHPHYAPEQGSLEAHFGPWGSDVGEVVLYAVTNPGSVLAHVASSPKLAFLAALLLPLAGLPLLSPRWCLTASPVLAIGVLSHFPAASRVDDHYLTPALPMLFAAAIHGYRRLERRVQRQGAVGVVVIGVSLVSALALGWSHASGAPFVEDARTAWAREVVREVRPAEQVQAPDELLPHLAERALLHRAPPPDRGADLVVLSIAHRARFVGDESLTRTLEEPVVRDWLAKDGFGLVLANAGYLVFRRGADPRAGPAARYFRGESPGAGLRIAACLGVQRVERVGSAASAAVSPAARPRVRIEFAVRAPCPHDLVIRLGRGARPRRVELLFDGLLSPARLRAGDRVFSEHFLPGGFTGSTLRVGALRTSGTRPQHEDPVAATLQIE